MPRPLGFLTATIIIVFGGRAGVAQQGPAHPGAMAWAQRLHHYQAAVLEAFTRDPGNPQRWPRFAASAGPYEYPDVVAYLQRLSDSADIPPPQIDSIARATWNRAYPSMRAAFMASPQVTDAMRESLRRVEMNKLSDMVHGLIDAGLPPAPSDVALLQAKILEYYEHQRKRDDNESYLAVANISGGKFFPREQVAAFYAGLAKTTDDSLRAYARLKQRLYQAPLNDTFIGLDGHRVTLSQLRGKVVLVDFWGVECSTCIATFPKIKTLYDTYHGRGFEVITVNLNDHSASMQQAVAAIYAKYALPWTLGYDQKNYATRYGIRGVPEMLLLDRQGYVIDSRYISERELETHLQRLLP